MESKIILTGLILLLIGTLINFNLTSRLYENIEEDKLLLISMSEEINNNIDEMDGHHNSYMNLLTDIPFRVQEDIAMEFVENNISQCWIYGNGTSYKEYIPCDVHIGSWGNSEEDFYTIEIVVENGGIK